MAGLFGSPSVPTVAAAPPPPVVEDAAENVAAQERERALRVRGRSADIMTSGAGVTDEIDTAKKRLLGA